MTIKSLVKNTVLSALRGSGAFSAVSRSKRRQSRLLILCYHGIALRDEHLWSSGLYIAPDQFRQRLGMLKSLGANVIPLTEGIERLRTNSLPPLSVAITFDDGFYDFHRHAVPILRAFDYPCTLYLTTYYCAHRIPVFNLIVNYMLWKSGNPEVELPAMGIRKPMPARNTHERVKVVEAILRGAAMLTTWEKDQVAREIGAHLGIDYDELVRSRILQIMSPEEVTATANAGVQIELHTHRHRTPRDRSLFQQEIRDNCTRIQEFTGRGPIHFCYPSGDYAREFVPWLQELGVRSATTCERGLADAASEPLMLPRVLDDADTNTVDFESWLCGVRI